VSPGAQVASPHGSQAIITQNSPGLAQIPQLALQHS